MRLTLARPRVSLEGRRSAAPPRSSKGRTRSLAVQYRLSRPLDLPDTGIRPYGNRSAPRRRVLIAPMIDQCRSYDDAYRSKKATITQEPLSRGCKNAICAATLSAAPQGQHVFGARIRARRALDAFGIEDIARHKQLLHIEAHRACLRASAACDARFGFGDDAQLRQTRRAAKLATDHHERCHPADAVAHSAPTQKQIRDEKQRHDAEIDGKPERVVQ